MLEIILTTLCFLVAGLAAGAVYYFAQKRKPQGSEMKTSENQTPADETADKNTLTAVILCSGQIDRNPERYAYRGVNDCGAALAVGDGGRICTDGCIGLGSCAAVCPEHAIDVKKGLAYVNFLRCTGCGECIAACPKKLIVLKPRDCVRTNGCVRGCPGGICGACVK